MPLEFEWDVAKAKRNLQKHNVSFEEASTVFSDPLSLTIDDALHSNDEERFIILGSLADIGYSLLFSLSERPGSVSLLRV